MQLPFKTILLAVFTAIFFWLSASTANAQCLPPLNTDFTPRIVASENTKGCWVGWWCPDKSVYIAAATKNKCGLVASRTTVAKWLTNPSVDDLYFGKDPYADDALRAVWAPEFPKLVAIKPVVK